MQTEDARRVTGSVNQSPLAHALLDQVEFKSIKTIKIRPGTSEI